MRNGAAIYGAGGHARVVTSILRKNGVSILGFFDDSYSGPENIQGAPVLGTFNDILDYQNSITSVYLAIGDNDCRRKAFAFLHRHHFQMPALIHPQAIIEDKAKIQTSSVVCVGSIIGTQVSIGKGAVINTGCAVDHESIIGDFVHLAPKTVIAGRTHIGANTFIGMNACIADKLRVGENVSIGAGSVVLKNVPDNSRIVGVFH